MSAELGFVIAVSALVAITGVVLILARRRVAANAAAAGVKGMGTPRSAAALGAFFLAIGLLSPLMVHALNVGTGPASPLSRIPESLALGMLLVGTLVGFPLMVAGLLLSLRAGRAHGSWAVDEGQLKPPRALVVGIVMQAVGVGLVIGGLVVFIGSAS